MVYASSVPTSERYAYPATLETVSAPGSPSTDSVRGTRNSPPAVSCQPVDVSSEAAGRPQRLVRVSPSAMDIVPASPAAMPIASSRALAVSTASATPPAPSTPATTVRRRTRSLSSKTVSPATTSGCAAPRTAAIPPGSRYAAANSSEKKTPMFSMPSTADLHHQWPRGSLRVTASSSSPAGSARSMPLSRGRSGGRNSVVTA